MPEQDPPPIEPGTGRLVYDKQRRTIVSSNPAPRPGTLTVTIGDTLWTLNSRDRRVGWRSEIITGETRLSWILGDDWRQTKVLKSDLTENMRSFGREQWFTERGKEDYLWREHHRRNISALVGTCKDVAKLKAIGEIVGYEVTS